MLKDRPGRYHHGNIRSRSWPTKPTDVVFIKIGRPFHTSAYQTRHVQLGLQPFPREHVKNGRSKNSLSEFLVNWAHNCMLYSTAVRVTTLIGWSRSISVTKRTRARTRVWASRPLAYGTHKQQAMRVLCLRGLCTPLTKHEEVARVGDVDHPYHSEEPVAGKNHTLAMDTGFRAAGTDAMGSAPPACCRYRSAGS